MSLTLAEITAIRAAKIESQITITITPTGITIAGPYSADNNDRWRGLGGKFSGGAWALPDNDTVRETIAEMFGGKSELVEALVPAAGLRDNGTLQVGGYVLATRRYRDSAPQLADGVSLAAGRLRSSGGSVKSPRVDAGDASYGIVFRLCCRAAFAEKCGLKLATESSHPSIEI